MTTIEWTLLYLVICILCYKPDETLPGQTGIGYNTLTASRASWLAGLTKEQIDGNSKLASNA